MMFRGNFRRQTLEFVYLVVLEKSLRFERNGPAAMEDAGFGGSGRSLPNSDNLKAIAHI